VTDGNCMTEVQKWRMGVEGRMSTLEQENKNQTDSLDRIETAVGNLTDTVTIHHKQSEERMSMGREKMNRIDTRGWINVSLVFVIGVIAVYHVFDLTVASIIGGSAAFLGLVAKVKQLL